MQNLEKLYNILGAREAVGGWVAFVVREPNRSVMRGE
jgi:hypothetical protein